MGFGHLTFALRPTHFTWTSRWSGSKASESPDFWTKCRVSICPTRFILSSQSPALGCGTVAVSLYIFCWKVLFVDSSGTNRLIYRTPLYCRYSKSGLVDLSTWFSISGTFGMDAAFSSGLSLSMSRIRNLSDGCWSIKARGRPKTGEKSSLLGLKSPPPVIHNTIEAESVKIFSRCKSSVLNTQRKGS